MVLIRFVLLLSLFPKPGCFIRKGIFLSPPTPSEYCLLHNVSCIDLPKNQKSCLSADLTYHSTSLVFAEDSKNISNVFSNLRQWSALKAVPECWSVLQPFLCSVYLPKCENGLVERSSYELCQRTREPCKSVAHSTGWPEFLHCEALHFQPGCYPLAARQKFNRTSTCLKPLKSTENPSNFYDNIKGCGIQCMNPMFTKQEHEKVHTFIAILGSVCLLSSLFAILTFLIDWKSSSKYPTIILFFINLCLLVCNIGWMLQFSGLREAIVCRQDGTMRLDEPKMNEGESPWCTIVFIIVYYFVMSAVMWFVALSYSWYVKFQSLGSRTSSKEIEAKSTYFHIFAWGLPFVLTIVVIAMAEIESDSLSGICFVGFLNHALRAGLMLTPVGAALCLGLYFLVKGVLILIRVRQGCPDVVSDRASLRIQFTILRICVFITLSCLFFITSLIIHIYIFTNAFQWRTSFRNYFICLAKKEIENTMNCALESRPNLGAIILNIFTFFGASMAMSSWLWTRATFRTWSRYVRTRLLLRKSDPVKVNKQRAVARVFAQRRDGDGGQSAPSLATTHDDPVGMNIELNSALSRPESSAGTYRPTARRRSRRPRPVRRHNSQNFRHYSDSDIQSMASYMSRRISGESVRMPESEYRNSFYSRQHTDPGFDIRAWAQNAAKRTRKTKIDPKSAPDTVFHKREYKLQKRHEAALERAARNSEVSSVISDGVSELSSAVFDRNLPLPPIGTPDFAKTRKPDYSIFTASSFAPGELKKLNDPLNPDRNDSPDIPCSPVIICSPDLPGTDTIPCAQELPSPGSDSPHSERVTRFKRPMTAQVADIDDDSLEDVSELEM